jgi:hypothetical protein
VWGQLVAAARQRQAAGGRGEQRGQCSDGRGWRGRGRGASRRCGQARGELNWGREGLGVGVPRRAGAAAGGDRRQPSIGWCDALGEQLRGHRASLGHKESSCGVVVVWG